MKAELIEGENSRREHGNYIMEEPEDGSHGLKQDRPMALGRWGSGQVPMSSWKLESKPGAQERGLDEDTDLTMMNTHGI